ncbi:MAG TPA: pseudouridine synthase [Phycisphaerae bacterium]|nr:pseudouridine synthase [Phycisphaerae bacterium]
MHLVADSNALSTNSGFLVYINYLEGYGRNKMQVRLQKFMADCGIASRRKCEELITQGQVRVNGEVRAALPVLIDPVKDEITVGDQVLEPIAPEKLIYFLLHKPKGVLVTRHDPSGRRTVYDLLGGITQRVFPVGRLEMDARGLVLLTNDGELANRLAHPRYGVEKTYVVTVEGNLSSGTLEKIKKGVWLGPTHKGGRAEKTQGLKARLLARERGNTVLEIKINEGKNREIPRVLARSGFHARDIFRVAIGDKITVKGLAPGERRELSEKELQWLRTISSHEYHESKRSATQRWYERKEMEKERKRLERK